MKIGRNKPEDEVKTGEDETAPVESTGVDEEVAPDVPPTEVPMDETVVDDEPDEVTVTPPVQTGTGWIDRYPNSPNRIQQCTACGHNHAAGQFMSCQGCGQTFTVDA